MGRERTGHCLLCLLGSSIEPLTHDRSWLAQRMRNAGPNGLGQSLFCSANGSRSLGDLLRELFSGGPRAFGFGRARLRRRRAGRPAGGLSFAVHDVHSLLSVATNGLASSRAYQRSVIAWGRAWPRANLPNGQRHHASGGQKRRWKPRTKRRCFQVVHDRIFVEHDEETGFRKLLGDLGPRKAAQRLQRLSSQQLHLLLHSEGQWRPSIPLRP